ncbi:MAG: DNA-binding protein [Thermoprotei archaeon]|nr:MAG: DNA-binding protein [Thermoprotei archaeon]
MTLYVFDASSITNLVKRGLPSLLIEGITLDLAIYECLNAVWKEYKLLGRIDRETALSLIKAIGNVLTVIKMESIKGFEDEVFSLACKENLTIYDASYLYTSIKMQATLITDDQKLREKSSKYIKVLNTEQLIQHATRKPKRT